MNTYKLLEETIEQMQVGTLLESKELKIIFKRTPIDNQDYYQLSLEVNGDKIAHYSMFITPHLSEDDVKEELAAQILKNLTRLGTLSKIEDKKIKQVNNLPVFNVLKDSLSTAEWLIKSYLRRYDKGILEFNTILDESDTVGYSLDVKLGEFVLGTYQTNNKNMSEEESKNMLSLLALNYLARIGIGRLFELELQNNNLMTQDEISEKIKETIKQKEETRRKQREL